MIACGSSVLICAEGEAFSKVKELLRKTKARTLEALFEATAQVLWAVSADDARGYENTSIRLDGIDGRDATVKVLDPLTGQETHYRMHPSGADYLSVTVEAMRCAKVDLKNNRSLGEP
jgi:hypothetical protein